MLENNEMGKSASAKKVKHMKKCIATWQYCFSIGSSFDE